MVVISLLRGINVGGRGMIKMDALRALYESLGLRDVRTFIQSGNVVFRAGQRGVDRLPARIEEAIEREFGFRPPVIHRTVEELRRVIARNPFASRAGIEPGKLLVTFLAADPGEEARQAVRRIRTDPEEVWIEGRELWIYFPNGAGKSKISLAAFDRALKTPGTGRNWNSVLKLLALAEELENRP